MKCIMCDKEAEIDGYCKNCYKLICMADLNSTVNYEWKDSLSNNESIEKQIDGLILHIISQCNAQKVREKVGWLIDCLKCEIEKLFSYYSKKELLIALLSIKELTQRAMFKKEYCGDWLVVGDIVSFVEMAEIVNSMDERLFKNNPIDSQENMVSPLQLAIRIARRINTINSNCGLMGNKEFEIIDIIFEAINTPESDKYFDEYYRLGILDKPEDYDVKNEPLRVSLEKRGLTPKEISSDIDDEIKAQLGFSIDDLKQISRMTFFHEFSFDEKWEEHFEKEDLISSPSLDFFQYDLFLDMMQKFGIERRSAEKAIQFFDIGRQCSEHPKQWLEMGMFFVTDNVLCVANINCGQYISTFEKCIMGNHFIDVFGIEKTKTIVEAQKHLSQYFAASIADVLLTAGYLLPMNNENGRLVPRFEISKIKSQQGNLLNGYGDIDVLAYDEEKETILAFEAKYYMPAIKEEDLFNRDQRIIEQDEVIRKVNQRENVIREHQSEFMQLFGVKKEKCNVKSYLITPRANYYALVSMGMNYLTWGNLLTRADKHDL